MKPLFDDCGNTCDTVYCDCGTDEGTCQRAIGCSTCVDFEVCTHILPEYPCEFPITCVECPTRDKCQLVKEQQQTNG